MRKKNGIYIENVNFIEEELDFTGTVFFCLFLKPQVFCTCQHGLYAAKESQFLFTVPGNVKIARNCLLNSQTLITKMLLCSCG